MKVKTAELEGPALDWAAMRAEEMVRGLPPSYFSDLVIRGVLAISTDWAQGGLIIEREKISTWDADGVGCCFPWGAHKTIEHNHRFHQRGPTALIAALRCFVASRLGDEIEVPDELMACSNREADASQDRADAQRPRSRA